MDTLWAHTKHSWDSMVPNVANLRKKLLKNYSNGMDHVWKGMLLLSANTWTLAKPSIWKHGDVQIQRKKKCCQLIRNHVHAKIMEHKRNKRLNDTWQNSRTLATLHPSRRTQFDIKEKWPALSQGWLHRYRWTIYFFDADRMPVVGTDPGPTPFLGIELFSLVGCKRQY